MTSPEDNLPHGSSLDGEVKAFPVAAESNLTSVVVTKADIVTGRVATFDFYSCQEAIKRLNDYLDSELDPAEKEDVIRHLKVCQPCLERFHFQKALMISLRDKVRHIMAPTNLKDRLSSIVKSGK